MIKTLAAQVKQYKRAAILTPIYTSLEVVMDVLIPYVTAKLIDLGINAGHMGNVYLYGGIMIAMAFLSLFFGIRAGQSSAYASSGFAGNLREAMYRNIQTFSFSDIDKFSTSGLVTRMTTDVSNLQGAFQQILRISVRAPLRMLFSIFAHVKPYQFNAQFISQTSGNFGLAYACGANEKKACKRLIIFEQSGP